MDAIDLKIISILEKNARIPLKNLAEQVFLSSPATASRIEKLEKEGIIISYSARLDLKKLGLPITAFINLDLDPKQKPTFYPFICSHPNVLECNCVTGRYSQLLKVAFESTEALDAFIGELNNFGHTETQIAFSSPKPPCEAAIEEIENNKH
ncbi:MAG: Lrp/AsnC family transcriptional regulator [Clostridia bacterium]|nr:Lrp/AsnC family transcriptional regulator [Clostridia bacterium]MDO5332044.1 Lrp/AsnC family transcriptional regulator [Bacillota bacterium]